MTELLPCPFCGENDSKVFPENESRAFAIVRCMNCLAEVCGDSGYEPKIESAIAAWNTRASPVDVQKIAYNAMGNVMDCFTSWTGTQTSDDGRSTHQKVEAIIAAAIRKGRGEVA